MRKRGRFWNRIAILDILTENIQDKIRLTPQNFSAFTYSLWSHFKHYVCSPAHQEKYAYLSDLKVYQDLLAYNFIIQNFPPGSRLLEIGGGNSRIIDDLKFNYDFWNLDRLEGQGHCPTDLENSQGYRQIWDYLGNFNPELPDQYFDGVYSISTLEHVPPDQSIFENVLLDINRVLKPGGWSLHCIDLLLGNLGVIRANGIIDYLYANQLMINPRVPVDRIIKDKDLFTLSIYQYYTRWLFVTRKLSFKKFGHPFSYNLLWKIPAWAPILI